jgi:hypothetical protein
LQPNGPDSGQLDLLSGTSSASECLPSTGPASRSGMTFITLIPTPSASDCGRTESSANQRRQAGHQNDLSTAIHSLSTSSVAGSPVNLTALQESVRHLLTSVISGQSAPGSSLSLDLDGACLKTCRGFYQAKAAASSPALSVTWPRWGTALAGQLTALSMWERRTGGTESSLWRTPDTHQCGGAQPADKRAAGGHGIRLQDQVKQWPTPAAQDAKNATLPPSQMDRDTVPGAVMRAGDAGSLNVGFVEWLMGFPKNWTEV